jgi:hypothetical protein
MILDAMKFLAELSRKGDAPQLILADDPRKARYVVGGEVLEIDKNPEPRDHQVKSLDEVVALANRFAKAGGSPVVWYDESDVCLVLDDDGHRVEMVTLPLVRSDAFETVVGLRGAAWLDQKPFIRLLRVDLARCHEPRLLLEPARSLSFDNGTVTTGRVGKSDESLGRTITSKVQAGSELPDTITLTPRLYKTAGEADRYPIECAVEIEPSLGKLRIVPLPDEIERVEQQAMAAIRARLDEGLEGAVPCYYGQP